MNIQCFQQQHLVMDMGLQTHMGSGYGVLREQVWDRFPLPLETPHPPQGYKGFPTGLVPMAIGTVQLIIANLHCNTNRKKEASIDCQSPCTP